jgi:hypothetical protein
MNSRTYCKLKLSIIKICLNVVSIISYYISIKYVLYICTVPTFLIIIIYIDHNMIMLVYRLIFTLTLQIATVK